MEKKSVKEIAAEFKGLISATKQDLRVMNRDESTAFLKIMMNPEGGEGSLCQYIIENLPAAQILAKRLEYHGITTYDPGLVSFLGFISKTPGNAVMWAHYVATKGRKLNRAATLSDFSKTEFSWGIPTDEFYQKVWDSQKIEGGNFLDMNEAWIVEDAGCAG